MTQASSIMGGGRLSSSAVAALIGAGALSAVQTLGGAPQTLLRRRPAPPRNYAKTSDSAEVRAWNAKIDAKKAAKRERQDEARSLYARTVQRWEQS